MSTSWIPLESNPAVMNKFLQKLGVPSEWEICDIFGFGPDELAIVPRPVASVILLFPYNDAYEKRKNEEELKLKDKGQQVSDDIYFVKQYVHNACGTMALIHSVANNRDKIKLNDGILKRFLDDGKNMSPSDRGEMLTKAEDMINTHKEIATEGQTAAPNPDDVPPYHFIAFVCKDGCLYELDGGKFDPINHGPTKPDSLLEDTVNLIQEKFVVQDPDSIYFTLLALSNVCDAY
ncbi:ubiquitin C-terminal hydrolase UCHL1-like [Acyrthosiphon pisum]|uniref:Ubiquitin carboxyl-terminal hydrolase n=1 Tax=Acyrthosiphon pisum TaxID=7029 RepID=C4WTW9_ACYPI|nr:ubiquitin C-terminal hydrolase UCHL1-like [Acyrthosiphon pisum]BAH71339.1 ACYPI006329 [Acyrthosiphon pisum]|eukprot:NP_001156212.1 ubiquitin C-terminal hydrolase UCHL1-like [Acyrthosiphon pisum]